VYQSWILSDKFTPIKDLEEFVQVCRDRFAEFCEMRSNVFSSGYEKSYWP